MSVGNAGRGSLFNEAMNAVQNQGGHLCNGAEHGLGLLGCGIWQWGHHSSQVVHTVTTTIFTQSVSRTAASASGPVTSLLSSGRVSSTSRAIPSASSISSLFSSTIASIPRPAQSTSILSKSGSATLSEASITSLRPTTSTSIPARPTSNSLETFLSSLLIPLSSTESAKGLSKTSLITSQLSNSPTTRESAAPTISSTPSSASLAFVTALSITAPYPSTLAPFFPSQTSPSADTNPLAAVLPQGLGPESASGQQASREGGIIAGLLLGVLVLASLVVAFIYTRYRRSREHRRSIGSSSLNGDYSDDRAPILGFQRKASSSGTLTGSLRTKNKSYSRTASRRDTAPPATSTMGYGMSGALESYPYPSDYERPVTLPAPPAAFAPLRANRSSSVYSGSILNALSDGGGGATPTTPARNPRRGVSLNFGLEGKDEVKRESWRGRGRGEDGDQWPRTIEDFKRTRNLGNSMRRGRPVSEGEKTVYTVVAPDFGDEKEEKEVEVKVYREGWGESNPFADKETGIVKIGLRSDSGYGGSEKRESEKGYGYGYGYGGWKDEVVVDAVSVFSEEEERYEEMRRGYKGRIRFGMGVQRRLTAESRFRDEMV
ncbi:uncharacterized protein LY89DRAFT_668744 [Mollisia scopiformis]|uniref:Uncharacterized protein n=1 Tax=Mollisia scopiformis TaxID=149040 RepID=A0A194XB74_MOLSC|nr:uncharacterized protein LY89DRAFT_668744 [Mollisia scopiformis]KUJ17418.1 hypothetical protein LY89DRAFT_668744 [Mollisia scopiformis]